MEEKDIIEKVITKLNADDIWFTQKTDPTVEEAHNYYKLNEYGEPTEATIKNIVKEVNDLIGNGAVGIDDAIDLWESDQMIAYRLDYKDNLVTKFEPKPVVDNIEAYENPVQFPQSKKTESLSDNMTEEDIKNILKTIEELKTAKFSEFTEIYRNNNLPPQVENYCDTTLMDDNLHKVDNNGDYIVNKDQIRKELIKTLNWFLPKAKKTEAKTKKTEGAGAGYEIRGTVLSAKVNNFEIIGNTTNQYNEKIYELKCDIDVKLEDVQFESYEYGGKIDFPIDGKVTYLIISENGNNDVEGDLTNSDIESALDGAKIKEMLGGGWVHETFTGDFSGEFDGDVYGDYYALDFEMTLTQGTVVDFIDKKVDGVIDEVTYCVYDREGDPVDDFTDKDEAIEYAKKNDCIEVIEKYHDYELVDANGSIDDNSYEDGDIVWEREYTKNYKFDDEVEESKKISEAKAENFTEDDYKKFCKFWVEANDDNYVDFEGNEPEEPPIRYYPHEDEDDSYLFHSFRDMFNDLEIGEAILMDYEDGQVDELNKAGITEGDIKKLDKQFNYGLNEKTEEGAIVEYMKNEGASSGYTTDEAIVTYFDNPIPMTEAKKTGATFDDKVKAIKKSLKKKDGRLSDETAEEQAKKIAGSMIKKENFRSYKKDETVNFNNCTKEKIDEDYQKRLDEVNNKSQNIISDMFTSSDFDSDTPAGQIVMRTSEVFNALSDKGYDVDVAFDNGESTSAIQLGQQGGKVMITITNADQPLRAFTVGNFEVNDDNIKILQDIQDQISVL